ncbi:unnamed protein product, partial [Discosporangium mesarthrocarpum]
MVRRVRTLLGTSVQVADAEVLEGSAEASGTIYSTMSLVWGWMQRVLVQIARDSPGHSSTAGRLRLAWECLHLMRFLLCSRNRAAVALVHCPVHRALALESARAAGVTPLPEESVDEEKEKYQGVGGSSMAEFAHARTGLEVVARLLSAHCDTAAMEIHRAHPMRLLTAGAADVLAEGVSCGDRNTVDTLASLGIGLRLGLAAEEGVLLVQESRRMGVESIHLCWAYPAGRQARVKLLDRILSLGHLGLLEQVLTSGLLEFSMREMIPDTADTDVVNVRIPSKFARYNGTPLVRNEGLALLERVAARRRRCPGVASEVVRQAIRHEVAAEELKRLRNCRRRSVREGVGACLRTLARLESPVVDGALVRAGVPSAAIVATRKSHTDHATRKRWAGWLRSQVDKPQAADPHGYFRIARPKPVPEVASGSVEAAVGRRAGESEGEGIKLKEGKAGREKLGDVVGPERRSEDANQGTLTRLSIGTDKDGIGGGLKKPQSWSIPNSDRNNTPLLPQGDLSSLSLAELVHSLAYELGVSAAHVSPVAVDGGPPTAARFSMEGSLADHLWTHCLAGVLHIPGLLHLQVEGKGRLTWDGEEV